MKEKVLDHGFVEVIDSLGSDLTVVNSARVSFGQRKEKFDKSDERLVRYLAKHKHYSPFRHLQIQFHIKAPEFVMRQWYKHVVGIETTSSHVTKDHAWNEISGRYVPVEEYYEPTIWRKQSKDNKQASEGELEEVTNKKEIYEKMSLYRNHGIYKERYLHLLPGNNFRLTNLQASIGFSQLKRIKLIKKRRKEIFFLYKELLKKNRNIKLQKFEQNINPMFWTLAINLDYKKKLKRKKLIDLMMKRKIETRNGFYSPNRLSIYKKFKSNDLKICDKISENIICLPLYNALSNKNVKYIAKNFLELVD